MRVPLSRCAVLLYATVVVGVRGEPQRTVRGTLEDDSSRNRSLKRALKKGDNTDDYYFQEPKKSKGLESQPRITFAPIPSPSKQASPVAPSGVAPPMTTKQTAPPVERKRKGDGSSRSTKQQKSSKGSKASESAIDFGIIGDGKGKGKGKSKGDSGKGKGKGKGKGGKGQMNGTGQCAHAVALQIAEAVPQVVTRNPDSCCHETGPVAVYVTHGLRSEHTFSGLELFWDEIYNEIERTSLTNNVCFVLTGIDAEALAASKQTLDDVLIQTNRVVSGLDQVAAMMVTDPTANTDLITEIRRISDSALLPSIGVFNAGYNNVLVESILSGQERLPYVGYLNDSDYGIEAGKISLNLLNGVAAKPLCLNSRFGSLDFVGQRCAAYYNEITDETVDDKFGIPCSANSTATEIGALLNQPDHATVNAVWTSLECCSAAAEAIAMVRDTTERTIVMGCQDGNANAYTNIDFVTQQPIALQAYAAASWVNFPVIQGKLGKDVRGGQYFPSLQSLINTAIFNTVIL
jgi:hypothetical protein